jgi:hypothetical protein
MEKTTRLNLNPTREHILKHRYAAKRLGMSEEEMVAQTRRHHRANVLEDDEPPAEPVARLDAPIRAAKESQDTSNP